MTWDILICSIPHRDPTMLELLAELDRQMAPGVGVIAFRDNLETPYGAKIAGMLAHSTADYVSCVDDDDMIAPDYITRITAALEDLKGAPGRMEKVAFAKSGAPIYVDYAHTPDSLEKILEALQKRPEGMTRCQISEVVFSRNSSALEIKSALQLLLQHKLAFLKPESTNGRDAKHWFATTLIS